MTRSPMRTISLALIAAVVGKKLTAKQNSNANSVIVALSDYGASVGLDQPHRLAQYLSQIMHENGAFNYDREVWGPTPAQKRYEGRKDLGNTQKGDGSKFRGRTGIQITGRANTTEFRNWCRKLMAGTSLSVPDFVETPDAMNTDPWEGLGPIWYWDTKKLNRLADQGDIEQITKAINGGLNGYQDRLNWYARTVLVMLGYGPKDVAVFQKAAGLQADGIPGPRTRAALHAELLKLTSPVKLADDVAVAPVVTEVEVVTPVVPAKVEEKVKEKTGRLSWLTGLLGSGGIGLGWLAGMDWQAVIAGGVVLIIFLLIFVLLRTQIIAAVREIKAEL